MILLKMNSLKTVSLLTLGTLLVTTGLCAKRPKPPTRAFDAPGGPTFIRLDDKPGVNPPVDAVGNYLIGPAYLPALPWCWDQTGRQQAGREAGRQAGSEVQVPRVFETGFPEPPTSTPYPLALKPS